MSVHLFSQKKAQHTKITLLTCYDYTFAKLLNQTAIDAILVGDTCAMVMHGYPNTTFATTDMIAIHTQAVSKGANQKYIIADLPFMSYRKSLTDTMKAIETLIHAGAQAVKLEGAAGNLSTIQYIVESGVPVMGHIGLTPQHHHQTGGFKRPANDDLTRQRLLEEAQQLAQAGCFAIVLECLTPVIAKRITHALSIPTIGIGSGPHTSGQILVLQDMLGLQTDFHPKFLKTYHHGQSSIIQAVDTFVDEVVKLQYPTIPDQTY